MSEVKNIKDYLHLYLGCDVQYRSGAMVKMNTVVLNNMLTNKYELKECKPILRPLSDMAQEEELEWRSISGNSQAPTIMQQALEIKWFLSKYFDLYELIESGFAIDATTLNSPTP